jgi:hypothetical protein
VKGEKNELSMYGARFENPTQSSYSCGILSDAISLYVKTENKTYRSLDLQEIVKYLIDIENGSKNIEDPVLKRNRLRSADEDYTPNIPEGAKDSDSLLIPPNFKDLFNN